ncbi:phosphatidylinositol-3-phosphatase SAC1 [Anthonomus grandis grandis]|uniref:phosphatidylinositol-3-phosphatase SAC1 n=1 Tax=Anthonomus grandis grandis TaxID=2921223 RepID=UPI00216617C3|nr:phosphatidylinositol-3-phosphatase SAC1 [Anthonomus grandis grandis]
MGSSDVYNDLTLYITPEKFYLEPKTGNELLIIDRASEVVSLQIDPAQIPAINSRKDFCGLLGSINLLAGRYLLIATQRDLVGYIGSHAIWKLIKTELIPYSRSLNHLSNERQADNNVYVSMIESVLATPSFYFSYSYDITHSIQRLHDISPDFWQQSFLERGDHRFIWNKFLLEQFSSFKRYALPLMHGFVSINQCLINGNDFKWTLISRRSIYRAGTRWFRRGIDKEGNVANFVETEQIVETREGDKASFVQIRGSIPLFWYQRPDLRYKPSITLDTNVDPQDHQSACLKHVESMSLIYGRQVMVDLVDQVGSEGRLEKAFKDTINRLAHPSAKYEPFDFHAECRKMKWHRLAILIDRVSLDQDEMGYFSILRDGTLMSLQEGVFRTNCIDCLDRTNVVQSMLAHRNLEIVLRKFGILRHEERLEDQRTFETLYKNVWADHADLISTQYSGTGALKTDFTRTGKRTKAGVLQDGINSLMRYYKNNFNDGFRQDSIDLFLGNGKAISPLSPPPGWRYVTFPSVLLIASAMFVASAILPAEYNTECLLYLMFWAGMVAVTAYYIFQYGTEFVDRPKLTFN